jgi:hypothetical protein
MTSAQARTLAWLSANYPPFATYAYAVQLRLADLAIFAAEQVQKAFKYAALPDAYLPMLVELERQAHRALVNYEAHRLMYARLCVACGRPGGEHGAPKACVSLNHNSHGDLCAHTPEQHEPYEHPKYGPTTRCKICRRGCHGYSTGAGAELCDIQRTLTHKGGEKRTWFSEHHYRPVTVGEVVAYHEQQLAKRSEAPPREQARMGFYEPPPQAPRRGSKARLPVG